MDGRGHLAIGIHLHGFECRKQTFVIQRWWIFKIGTSVPQFAISCSANLLKIFGSRGRTLNIVATLLIPACSTSECRGTTSFTAAYLHSVMGKLLLWDDQHSKGPWCSSTEQHGGLQIADMAAARARFSRCRNSHIKVSKASLHMQHYRDPFCTNAITTPGAHRARDVVQVETVRRLAAVFSENTQVKYANSLLIPKYNYLG